MTEDIDLLDLVEKSKANDLAFLLKAKEQSKARMKQNPTPDNISAFRRARAAVEEESRRIQGGSTAMKVFKTQLDACTFLRDSGDKISKSAFNRDVAAGTVSKNGDGYFEESALLGYAAAHLSPLAQLENRALAEASADRISADAKLKSYSAERARLKLEKEMGLLMQKTEHEEDLASRALFFRREIENFGRRKAGELILLVHGDEKFLPQFLEWWDRETGDWMDAWAADREFTIQNENREDSEEQE